MRMLTQNVVDELKRGLLGQNEEIAILRARMEEAERGKEGLLQVCICNTATKVLAYWYKRANTDTC